MTKQIVELHNINSAKANPKRFIVRLDKALSQSEYGTSFCKENYGVTYIDGLVDTVKGHYDYTKGVLNRAEKALHNKSINVKNRFLHSMNNDNFDKFVGYDSVRDANSDIRENIYEQKLVLKQLKKYTPDTIAEMRGSFDNCIHPVTYSEVKQLINDNYLE